MFVVLKWHHTVRAAFGPFKTREAAEEWILDYDEEFAGNYSVQEVTPVARG